MAKRSAKQAELTRVDEPKRNAAPCALLELPDELLEKIVRNVDEVAALARTCTQLAAITQSKREQQQAKERFAEEEDEPYRVRKRCIFLRETIWKQLPNGERHGYCASGVTRAWNKQCQPNTPAPYSELLAIDWFDDRKASRRLWKACGRPRKLVLYQDNLRQGRVRAWSSDGFLRKEYHYRDDELHGLWRKWDEDTGALIEQDSYDTGKQHGVFLQWSPESVLIKQAQLCHGVRIGTVLRWYGESGQLEQIRRLDERGKYHGEFVEWYDTPAHQMSERAQYDHGLKHGLYEFWDDHGRLSSSACYEDGLLHGRVYCLDVGNDQRETEMHYHRGVKHGLKVWTYYGHDKLGQIYTVYGSVMFCHGKHSGVKQELMRPCSNDDSDVIYRCSYDEQGFRHGNEWRRSTFDRSVYMLERVWIHGRREGYEIKRTEENIVFKRRQWCDGVLDGLDSGWFYDGSRKYERRWKQGVLDGEENIWHQDIPDEIAISQEWRGGVLHGTQEFFNTNGRMIASQEFRNGKRVKKFNCSASDMIQQ